MNYELSMTTLKKIQEYLFYLFLFLLPWQTRWIVRDAQISGGVFEYGRISIYSFDLIFLILLFFFLFEKFFSNQKSEIGNQGFKIRFPVFCFLISVFLILNIFISSDKLLSAYWWLRIAEGLLLLWLIKKINFSQTKAALAFIFSMTISAGLGIYQFLAQNVFASKWLGMASQNPKDLGVSVMETLNTRIVRAYGNLPHPNIFAGFLVLAIVLCFFLIIKYKKTRTQEYKKNNFTLLFYYFITLLLVAGLFFTFSRAAWLVLAIFFITLLLYYFITKKSRHLLLITYYLLPIILVVGCLTIIYRPLIQIRTSASNRLEIKSNTERLAGYSEAWQIIKKNPLTGVGLENYTIALQKNIPGQPAWFYQPVHNVFVLALSELGVPVFLFVIALLLYYFITHRHKFLFFTFHFSFFVIIILALFDHFFWTLPSGMLLIFVIAGLGLQPPKAVDNL